MEGIDKKLLQETFENNKCFADKDIETYKLFHCILFKVNQLLNKFAYCKKFAESMIFYSFDPSGVKLTIKNSKSMKN